MFVLRRVSFPLIACSCCCRFLYGVAKVILQTDGGPRPSLLPSLLSGPRGVNFAAAASRFRRQSFHDGGWPKKAFSFLRPRAKIFTLPFSMRAVFFVVVVVVASRDEIYVPRGPVDTHPRRPMPCLWLFGGAAQVVKGRLYNFLLPFSFLSTLSIQSAAFSENGK